jgi:hypothetical protein
MKGNKELVTHGMRYSRPYNTWNHMMSRCYRPRDGRWKEYGGRGIIVCDRWHIFENFWKDMKEGYSENLTLDRINNDGDYIKENCRWATQKEQCRNKRNTLKVDYQGKKRVLKELCEEKGLPYHRVYLRLFRYQWSLEEALSK